MSSDFIESFDTGIGALSTRWGSGIDTSTRGQVTLTGTSGFMETPSGPAAGHGYGTYTVVAKLSGDSAGPAVVLWPGDDVWPGPELDMVEVIQGVPYGTLHWAGANGRDAFASQVYAGLDETQVHTYSVDWEPGIVDFFVDGRAYGSFTANVGRDFDHGGVNMTMGILNASPDTSVTVYEVSYSPSGAAGVAPAAVESGSATVAPDPVAATIAATEPAAAAGAADDTLLVAAAPDALDDTIIVGADADPADPAPEAAAAEDSAAATSWNWGWHGWGGGHHWA